MTTPIFIYAKSKKKPLSPFYFPGPLLLAWLLDHFGRKKTLAFFLLMFSLCLLPMFASLGRSVCALLLLRDFVSKLTSDRFGVITAHLSQA